MSQLTYEASVYTRTIKYTNFKGETRDVELYFALDPIQLMQVIAGFQAKPSKSGNPAKRNAAQEITDEQQMKMFRDLASRSAGFPSDDGESWEPYEDFETTLAGKAFMTKLASSDADRREFAEKVILDPFRAFVGYAESDPSNNKQEVAQFKTMLQQMENVFRMPNPADETIEERRERLAAELAQLDTTAPPQS